jgi:hypothetical protein
VIPKICKLDFQSIQQLTKMKEKSAIRPPLFLAQERPNKGNHTHMAQRQRKKIARENGAKAAGTKTPEGIQKSSMNAVRHGLTGKTLVLCNESQAQYDALTQRYIKKFHPQDEVDMELIDDLVAARWRLQRVRLMQAAALDLEMDRQADEIEASFVNIDEPTRATLALTKLANTERTLQLLHRYETTYTRQYNRTLNLLESKRETELRNDPKNIPSASIPVHPRPNQC